MENPLSDPKAGEKAYYRNLGAEGMRHARSKPFSDVDCGRYLANMGALMLMLEPAPKRILDFGCGTGWTSLFLARAGYDVLGVDISEEAIEVARECAKESGLASTRFESADYEEFNVSGEYDYVLFYDALHHAEDERAALRAAYRALKPGGVLFAFEPGAGHSRSAGAVHAVETYGVHEKEMPPRYVWKLGRETGFTRKVYLPLPHEAARSVYRRDFLKTKNSGGLWLEKIWGYFRAMTKAWRVPSSGLLIMWK